MLRKLSLWILLGSLVLMFPGQNTRASRTGTTSTPVTATFGDNAGDQVQSDGLGAYVNGQGNVKAIIDSRGDFDLDTNTSNGPALRTLLLEFSNCASGTGTCNAPFVSEKVDSYLSTGVGGLLSMAVGSSVASGLQISFTTSLTPNTQWFVNFSPGSYPETSKVTVTRTSSSTWTIQAPSSAIARLSSAPTTGKFKLTDQGDFFMPFSVVVAMM